MAAVYEHAKRRKGVSCFPLQQPCAGTQHAECIEYIRRRLSSCQSHNKCLLASHTVPAPYLVCVLCDALHTGVHFSCLPDFTSTFGAGIHSFVCLRRKLSFYSALGQVDCSKLDELAHDHEKVRGSWRQAHCMQAKQITPRG